MERRLIVRASVLTGRGGCLIKVLCQHWFIDNLFLHWSDNWFLNINWPLTCNIGLNVTKTLQELSLLSESCFLQNAHLYFQIWSTIVVVSLSRQQLPYPASRGYILAVWAVVRTVAFADNLSISHHTCAKLVMRFAGKINCQVCRHGQILMAQVSRG